MIFLELPIETVTVGISARRSISTTVKPSISSNPSAKNTKLFPS